MNPLQVFRVPFHQQVLITVKDGGIIRVAMKPICEALGLDWKSQYSRIQNNPVLSSSMVMTTMVAGDEKQRDMLTLPVNMLHGWLFGLQISRVKEHLRPLLTLYQRECYWVLDSYFRRTRLITTSKPLNSNQLLATQRHVQKLLVDLKHEQDPAIRATLLEMLDQTCRLIGINPPSLSAIAYPDNAGDEA